MARGANRGGHEGRLRSGSGVPRLGRPSIESLTLTRAARTLRAGVTLVLATKVLQWSSSCDRSGVAYTRAPSFKHVVVDSHA